MDYQPAFNLAIGAAAFFGGFLFNKLWAAIEKLDNEARQLPKIYVSRDDYRADLHEIKVLLARISDKLELKVDK
jgi:hypothetical protein